MVIPAGSTFSIDETIVDNLAENKSLPKFDQDEIVMHYQVPNEDRVDISFGKLSVAAGAMDFLVGKVPNGEDETRQALFMAVFALRTKMNESFADVSSLRKDEQW